MTHFVRFALIGAMAAGASIYALAQDDDLDALLMMLEDDPVEEVAAEDASMVESPTQDAAVAEETPAADPAPVEEEAVAEVEAPEADPEPAAEEFVAEVETPAVEEVVEEVAAVEPPAEEPAADEASLDDLLADVTEEEPAAEDVVEEVAEAVEEPAVEEVVEEVAAVEPPAEEPVADDASLDDLLADVTEEEPAVEEVVEEVAAVEPSAEELVADDASLDDLLADVTEEEPAVEEAEEAATEEVAEAVEEPAVEEVVEEVAEVEPPAEEEPTEADAEDVAEVVEAEPAEEVVAEVKAEEPKTDVAKVEEAPKAPLSEKDQALNDLEMLMRLKNKGIENHAMACLTKARELMNTPPPAGKEFDQYQNAIKMYDDAKKYFGQVNRDDLIPLRNECDEGARDAQYRQALTLFRNNENEKALQMATALERAGHPLAVTLKDQITTEMNRPAEFRPNPTLPEYAKDEYKAKRLEIMDRMQRATTYYHLAKYKEANDQLELILRDDPSNEAAINLRHRIERRDAARARELKMSTHDEMIRQVEENWTPLGALGRNSEELYKPTVSKGEVAKVADDGKKEAAVIMEKLQYIRMPEFSIAPPGTLADVVKVLADASKEFDKPELPPEEKGVAFVLNLGPGGAGAAAPAEEDAEEDMFASEDEGVSSSGLQPIPSRIEMPYVTLKEALDMVCTVTNTKFIIKGKTVLIVRNDYVEGTMETRSYNVMSTIVEKVAQVNSELSAGSSSDESDDGGWGVGGESSMDAGEPATSDMWRALFTQLGVPFEGKASIVYLPTIGKLRVTNTAENLALFESVLEELNVTPYQIEVEARFVEVSQTDMNSLGFEWQLNNDIVGTVGSGIDWADSNIRSNAAGGLIAGGTGAGGYNVFRHGRASGTGDANFALHGGEGSINNGMRFLGDGTVYANRINLGDAKIAPNDEFATFSAVFGKMDMTMVLHMLAQRTDTDMLNSPKVLARPSQEAMIRVVTEWIYPTEFDVTELEEAEQNYNSGNSNLTGLGGSAAANLQAPPVKFAVEPQSFEKQEVGVSLQVVPEVSQEGQMINLLVNPKVVEYIEDFDYGMPIPYIQYEFTGNQITGARVEYYHVPMPQPKFKFREISTYLSVYNGATVVMGGLITEKRSSFEDKVPILGDLPFIGFLFRSTGEYSEKRNLLIFLTARLVDPAGRPLKTATDGRTGASAIDSGSSSTMSSAAQ